MCPLEVRSYGVAWKAWTKVVTLRPEQDPVTINEFLSDEERDVFRFCALDNSHSEIKVARNVGVGQEPEAFEVFKILGPGESVELNIRTRLHQGKRRFKLTQTEQTKPI